MFGQPEVAALTIESLKFGEISASRVLCMIERKSPENLIHVKTTKLNMYHSEKTKIEYKIREEDIHEKSHFWRGKSIQN